MTPLEAWHEVVRTRDATRLERLLADNVVFHSPALHRPVPGKAPTMAYLVAAMQVIGNPSFRYVREFASGDDALLEFDTEIDGVQVNGIDLLRFRDGQIVDFKVMVRPAKALEAVMTRMAALLQRH